MSDSPLPAGWYLNPAAGRQQYWDGATWLDVPMPDQFAVGPVTQIASPAQSAGSTPETSSLAVAALICAFLLPPVGWILGVRARREINQSAGAKTGSGIATASVWLSVLGTVGTGILVFLLVAGQMQLPLMETRSDALSKAAAAGSAHGQAVGLLYPNWVNNPEFANDPLALNSASMDCSNASQSVYPDDKELQVEFANNCYGWLGYGYDTFAVPDESGA